MIYNPTKNDVRSFWFNIYNKQKNQEQLSDLENIAINIINMHPEFNYIFIAQNLYLNYIWQDNSMHNLSHDKNNNPFLHLSMHLTIAEQLNIAKMQYNNQENNNINNTIIFNQNNMHLLHEQILQQSHDYHAGVHKIILAFTTMINHSYKYNHGLNIDIYIDNLQKLLLQ